MRLAYLSNSYIPSRSANSIQVMRMCEAFTKAGVAPCLIHPGRRSKECSTKEIEQFYGVSDYFQRIRIPEVAVTGRAFIYGSLAALVAKSRRTQFAYCRDIFSCHYALTMGIPAAFELHMLPTPGSKSQKFLAALVKHKHFTRLITITEALKVEALRTLKLPKSDVFVLPDAANEPSNDRAINLGHHGKLQVGYVGSLLPGKGVELIPEIAELCPWAFFHIVGGHGAELDQLIAQCNRHTNICCHGFVPPGMTYRYLQAFDVVLSPNQQQVLLQDGNDIGRFTSPLKIFEYMLAGKPIIASKIDVLGEILEDNRNAIMCQPDNPQDWADALVRLRASEGLRRRLGENAKSMALDTWTWHKRAEKALEIIRA